MNHICKSLFAVLFFATMHVNTKMVESGSRAGRVMRAMASFWMPKLSKNLQGGCRATNKCEELANHLAHVVAFAVERPDRAEVDKVIKLLKAGNGMLENVVTAVRVLSCYGEAAIHKGDLAELHQEPTQGYLHFEFPAFKSALSSVYEIIDDIGKKQNWTPEQIASEKEQTKLMLIAFINAKTNGG